MSFEIIREFENRIADFFGSKYAIAVDSCTHGLELCLRYKKEKQIMSPKRTYLSVPMLANKLNIDLVWKDENWKDYYYITSDIVDAAVLWERNSYVKNTLMCISFQFKKHLNLGRGGVILTDNKTHAQELKKMSYDGRDPNIPWRQQNIKSFGYHYYMTPETAKIGLEKIDSAISSKPRQWLLEDWPDLTKMDVFK